LRKIFFDEDGKKLLVSLEYAIFPKINIDRNCFTERPNEYIDLVGNGKFLKEFPN
jgi:hypothetical protein